MKMMMSELAGGILVQHGVHNHAFRNPHQHSHSNNNCFTSSHKYKSHIDNNNQDDEDDVTNGNEMIQSHIRITENPLPPPPVAAADDYIR